MKHKVENLVKGKWVQATHITQETKDTTKDGVVNSKTVEKSTDKTVNISKETAKTLNMDSKTNGVRYVAIKEKQKN